MSNTWKENNKIGTKDKLNAITNRWRVNWKPWPWMTCAHFFCFLDFGSGLEPADLGDAAWEFERTNGAISK